MLSKHTLIRVFETILLCFIICCIFKTNVYAQASKQRIYANNVQKSDDDFLTIIKAGFVENQNLAIDQNPFTFSTLNSTVVSVPLVGSVGGEAVLRLRFTGTGVPTIGTPIKIKIGLGGSLASLLGGVTFQAINGTGNNKGIGNEVGPIYNASDILGVLGGDNTIEFSFTSLVAFDGVKIKLGAPGSLGIGALTQAKVYEAYFENNISNIACNQATDAFYGSTGSIAGGLNAVTNPELAIDGDPNTATTLRANVSLLNKTFYKSIFNSTALAGDSVVLIIEPGPALLLDASLLSSSFKINTYKDNLLTENLALNNSLLTLSLLNGYTNKYRLAYPTTVDFSRIEIVLGEGLLTALSDLKVYKIGSIAPKPILNAIGLVNYSLTVCKNDSLSLNINSLTATKFKWFDAPVGGNLVILLE